MYHVCICLCLYSCLRLVTVIIYSSMHYLEIIIIDVVVPNYYIQCNKIVLRLPSYIIFGTYYFSLLLFY